jgi:hypothetical protein
METRTHHGIRSKRYRDVLDRISLHDVLTVTIKLAAVYPISVYCPRVRVLISAPSNEFPLLLFHSSFLAYISDSLQINRLIPHQTRS